MKLPFSFGIKFIFRLLLPGFIIAFALYPLGSKILSWIGLQIDYILFVSIGTIVFGWLMIVLDMQIYMVYEGRRFWPSLLRRCFLKRERRRLLNLRKTIRRTRKKDKHAYQEASVDCRRFPLEGETGKYIVALPTRLGNLIYSFEDYPKRVYGLNAPFFWPRLWVKLGKDLQTELDEVQAIADSTVYTSFALFVTSVFSFIYSLAGYINPFWSNLNYPPNILAGLGVAAGVLAFTLYRFSFHAHAKYGEMFKAVFDIYSQDLSFPQIEEDLKELLEGLPQKDRYRVIWRYLNNYRIKDPDTGRILTPQQWRVKNQKLGE